MAPGGLVIGSRGLIGAELLRQLDASGWWTVGTARRAIADSSLIGYDLVEPVDSLLNSPAVSRLRSRGTWSAFLVAGVSGYEPCVRDPEGTRYVNVTRSAAIAAALIEADGFVVYPSSSAVFGEVKGPCAEAAPTAPNSEYGRQKAEVEQTLLSVIPAPETCGGAAVVRLTKVLSPTGLVGRWIATLKQGGVIQAASNLSLSPISLPFAARGLIAIARIRRNGVYHLTGECTVTYFELAQRLGAALGANADRVRSVELDLSGELGTTNNAVLTMSQTTQVTGLSPQSLDSAIEHLVGSTYVSGCN